MKAVIYARYSSDSQREESIEGQLRECTAFAEKNGITILRHYIDRAYSAKTDNRPEFQNMIKDSNRKLFDMIIVWKLDRFARNRYDSVRYKAQLKKNGVKVVSATEVISDGAEGIILESVLEGYAEYYSADLSEKVIRGMTDNALKCKFNGGTRTIGYVIDNEQNFQIDPLTAPFVLEAYKKYDCGETMTAIRDWLNEHGVRKKYIEDKVVNATMEMLNDDAAIEAIISMLLDLQDRENTNLPLYEQQLKEADMGINNLLNAIQQGVLTKSTKSRLEELEAMRDELEEKIACEKLVKPKLDAELLRFWLLRFRKLDVNKKEHRQMLIDSFVNAIFLYDDKMLINFNYKEGTRTITFDDVATAVNSEASGSDMDCSGAPKRYPKGYLFFCS